MKKMIIRALKSACPNIWTWWLQHIIEGKKTTQHNAFNSLVLENRYFVSFFIINILRILQYGGRHWGISEKLLNWLLHFRESFLIYFSSMNSLILYRSFSTLPHVKGQMEKQNQDKKWLYFRLEAKYNLLRALWLF